jgi:mannose-6-phosphate isomerase-like protein (cupin superfamily)
MRLKVVAPHEGESLTVVGDVVTFKLTAADTAERFVLGEGLVAPGGGPPPHLHEREDELFYVLDGRMEFCCDTARRTLDPGDAAWAPRNVVHAFKNVGETPLRMLIIAIPTNFEHFYRECGEPFRAGADLPKPTPQSIQKLLATAPKYGLQIHPEHAFPNPSPPAVPRRAYWALGHRVEFALLSDQTDGHFSVFALTTPPGHGAPPHAHRAEDEVFYVLDGTFQFLLGDRRETHGAGTTVLVPRGTTHSFTNVGQRPARILSIHTPGGFERFFIDAGEPCSSADAPQPPLRPSMSDPARLVRLLDRHGMDLKPA